MHYLFVRFDHLFDCLCCITERGGESVMINFSTFNHSIFFINIQQFIINIQYIIRSIIINNITS
jgi:hypothetical protein